MAIDPYDPLASASDRALSAEPPTVLAMDVTRRRPPGGPPDEPGGGKVSGEGGGGSSRSMGHDLDTPEGRRALGQEIMQGRAQYEATLPKTNVRVPAEFVEKAVRQKIEAPPPAVGSVISGVEQAMKPFTDPRVMQQLPASKQDALRKFLSEWFGPASGIVPK